MLRLAHTRPIRRLHALIAGGANERPSRGIVQALDADDVQRLLVGRRWAAQIRLQTLCDLSRLAGESPLPDRERETIRSELSRLALRILWSEGLFGDTLRPGAPPAEAASRLLELAASDLLPEGPAFRIVMDRARELLKRHDVAYRLSKDDDLRDRLLALLVRAEKAGARVRIDDASA